MAAPSPPSSEQIPAPGPDLRRDLFRKEAVRANRETDQPKVDLEGPRGSAWASLATLASVLVVGLIVAVAARVEVTAQALGTLRASSGLRPVSSVAAGVVAQVVLRSGQDVEQGEVLVRLEARQLQAALAKRERSLESVRTENDHASVADELLFSKARDALARRQTHLRRQIAILEVQRNQRSARQRNLDELHRQGGASASEALSARESVQEAAASLTSIRSQIASLDLELADRQRAFEQRDASRRARVEEAEASVEEAQTLLEQLEIRAPASGRVESLLVDAGDVVAAGSTLAHVVPRGSPTSIVAFVPAAEAAFLRLGSEAKVEIASLPISDFGTATARVTRISSDVARPRELARSLGEGARGPLVRVELEVVENDAHDEMREHLRSGDRVNVRLRRRERRIIGLLFDFVRKWLD